MPFFESAAAIAKTPRTGRISPSNESSPQNDLPSTSFCVRFPLAVKTARAIGKSKLGPSFFMSAGARFTTTLLDGKLKPQFFIAAFTLSLDSLTDTSGKPTIQKLGSPPAISTSTST